MPVKLSSTGGGSVTLTTPSTGSDFTVTIPAATGTMVTTTSASTIEFAAGSAAAPSITTTGDTNTGIFFPAADTIAFTQGGVESMRIDSSGNVGVGTSSPGSTLDVNGAITGRAVSGEGGELRLNNPTNASVGMYVDVSSADNGRIFSVANNFTLSLGQLGGTGGNVLFYTAASERARIDSNGNLLVGTSSTLFASSHAFVNSGAAVLGLRNSGSTAGKYWQVGPDSNSSFKVYNQSSTGVFLSDGSTSWSSSSDERQKNIIEPISDATNKVASLRAVIGSYKNDETNKRRSFLIAQDVQQVLPEAVTEAPDGFLGVAYSDVIPLLVAAIQELKADNDAMKERIALLEAK